VLGSFGAPEEMKRVIRVVQEYGICWAEVTLSQGRTAMRTCVSSWATTDAGAELSVQADHPLRARDDLAVSIQKELPRKT